MNIFGIRESFTDMLNMKGKWRWEKVYSADMGETGYAFKNFICYSFLYIILQIYYYKCPYYKSHFFKVMGSLEQSPNTKIEIASMHCLSVPHMKQNKIKRTAIKHPFIQFKC